MLRAFSPHEAQLFEPEVRVPDNTYGYKDQALYLETLKNPPAPNRLLKNSLALADEA